MNLFKNKQLLFFLFDTAYLVWHCWSWSMWFTSWGHCFDQFYCFFRVSTSVIRIQVKYISLFGNIIRLSKKKTETLLRKTFKNLEKTAQYYWKFQKCKIQHRHVFQVERNQWHSNNLVVSCFGIGEKIWFWINSLLSGGETLKFGQKFYKMMHVIAIFNHQKSIFLKF